MKSGSIPVARVAFGHEDDVAFAEGQLIVGLGDIVSHRCAPPRVSHCGGRATSNTVRKERRAGKGKRKREKGAKRIEKEGKQKQEYVRLESQLIKPRFD